MDKMLVPKNGVVKTLCAITLIFSSVASQRGEARSCIDAFKARPSSVSKQQVETYRREIVNAASDYVSSGKTSPKGAVSGQLTEGDSRFLPVAPISKRNDSQKSHIITVGHEGDVFRVLYDFPFATHFHFVGGLSWHYLNPREVLQEIEARLSSIAPDVKVELVQRGMEDFPAEELDARPYERPVTQEISSLYHDRLREKETLAKPYIWKVTWVSPTLGTQTKLFYLQAFNFLKPDLINDVIAQIPDSDRVEGLMFAQGRYVQNLVAPLVNRLSPKGAIVWQHYLASENIQKFYDGRYMPTDPVLKAMLASPTIKKTDSYLEEDPAYDRSSPWATYVLRK